MVDKVFIRNEEVLRLKIRYNGHMVSREELTTVPGAIMLGLPVTADTDEGDYAWEFEREDGDSNG